MTSDQRESGIVLIDGKAYPSCVVGDPAAMAALDERYDQLLSEWELPVGAALDRLRAVFGMTPRNLAEGPTRNPGGKTVA